MLIARPNSALAGKEKIFLNKKVSIYKVYSTISMDRTHLFLNKQKHMMKNRAPPDKVGVLHRLLLIEFQGYTIRIDF